MEGLGRQAGRQLLHVFPSLVLSNNTCTKCVPASLPCLPQQHAPARAAVHMPTY